MPHPLGSVNAFDRITPAIARDLAGRLDAAGFDDALLGRAESVAPGAFDVLRLPLVLEALEHEATAAADLGRLLLYGDAVPAGRIRAALGEHLVAALAAAGILTEAPAGALASPFRLTPFQGLRILADPLRDAPRSVMGAGMGTQELAALIAPGPGSLLDVGGGAGALALVGAARGARSATTDLNPRAEAFARLNARLNGLELEVLTGDLFEPAAGRTFDAVVSQPPFVFQPPEAPAVAYLHGGPTGDAVVRRLVEGLPAVLAPGGRALVLFDALLDGSGQVHERVGSWLGDARVDMVILAAKSLGPDLQSMGYAALQSPELGPDYAAAARRYRAHLRTLGAVEFVRVLLVLRAGTGRFRVQIPVPTHRGRTAADLDRLLAALDLATGPAPAFLAACVRPNPRARWSREWTSFAPEAEPGYAVRFDRESLASGGALNAGSMELIEILAGAASVEEAVRLQAGRAGAGPAPTRDAVLGFVRDALARGLLVPGH